MKRTVLLLACVFAAIAVSAQTPEAAKPKPRGPVQPVADDDAGFRAIFDGKSLEGWDGDPTFWRAENDSIVGESTADFSIADMQAASRRAGVTGSVVVQCVSSIAETAELLAVAGGTPFVRGVVGWVDLTASSVADDIGRLREGPGGDRLIGIRHSVQAESDPRWLCLPDVRRGLTAVAEAGLAYDVLTVPHQLPSVIDTARDMEQLTFVLDHCSKPLIAKGETEPWASDVRLLGTLGNVFCKLSGLVTEADWHAWSVPGLRPYADEILAAFGGSRVMFGSDWPVCLLATTYEGWVAAAEELTSALSSDEAASFWHGAATRAYGLDRPAQR